MRGEEDQGGCSGVGGREGFGEVGGPCVRRRGQGTGGERSADVAWGGGGRGPPHAGRREAKAIARATHPHCWKISGRAPGEGNAAMAMEAPTRTPSPRTDALADHRHKACVHARGGRKGGERDRDRTVAISVGEVGSWTPILETGKWALAMLMSRCARSKSELPKECSLDTARGLGGAGGNPGGRAPTASTSESPRSARLAKGGNRGAPTKPPEGNSKTPPSEWSTLHTGHRES